MMIVWYKQYKYYELTYTMSEHNLPRLFTPNVSQRYMNTQDDLTLPTLKAIIKKQQDIIDNQCKIINRHDVELDILNTSLQEIRLILNGRQFMNRSVSFESNEPVVESTI